MLLCRRLQTAQYAFHNSPEYWDQPDQFRPQRFLSGKAAASAAFAPFGHVRQLTGTQWA